MEKREIERLVRKHVEGRFGSDESKEPVCKSENGKVRKEFIVAANWKMNLSAKEIRRFIEEMKQEEIPVHLKPVIFPPYPYLYLFQDMLRYDKIAYGAQDVAKEEKGAYTGEVSAAMLADCGCSYVLAGHSERRNYYGDTPQIVGKKAKAALDHGIRPVICIGEKLEERKNGKYRKVLKMQLDAAAGETGAGFADCMIAYEPVWAIGTGVIPELFQIEETHQFIHDLLLSYRKACGADMQTARILYGGSVSEKNVKDIASVRYVDGFLIGGASLKAERYKNILRLLNVDE